MNDHNYYNPNPIHNYYLCIARQVATLSPDPSSQIGVVLVRDGEIISTGINKFPQGHMCHKYRLEDRAQKLKYMVHAEMNALLNTDARSATLYGYGFAGAPCLDCAKHIIAAGVGEVIFAGVPCPDRWRKSLDEAAAMLDEARIPLMIVKAEHLQHFTPNQEKNQ